MAETPMLECTGISKAFGAVQALYRVDFEVRRGEVHGPGRRQWGWEVHPDQGAPPFLDPPGYARHRPESTVLYQLVEQCYPAFRELRAETGRRRSRSGPSCRSGPARD